MATGREKMCSNSKDAILLKQVAWLRQDVVQKNGAREFAFDEVFVTEIFV